MKKYEAQYPIEGSVALKSDCVDNIIEFPARQRIHHSEEHISEEYSSAKPSLVDAILSKKTIQNLRYGSIQGKAFNISKPWQSLLVGTLFLAFALACVYFAN